jgi:hypothetical protein
MSLSQSLNEFRFNLETLDLLLSMGRSHDEVVSTLGTLGFNAVLVSFLTGPRTLLNSVLLRLQLYSEQNFPEQKVRSSLAVLNNAGVNSLVDYLYGSSTVSVSVSVPVVSASPKKVTQVAQQSAPAPQPVVVQQVAQQAEEQEEEEEDVELEEDEEESHFETFFTARVRESEDPTNVVKMSEMYSAFTSWWSEQYEEDAPSKDELKEFLSERLGRTIKTTVTNVSLA